MRVEVRCCCNPGLLLGTLEVARTPDFGTVVRFPLEGPLGAVLVDDLSIEELGRVECVALTWGRWERWIQGPDMVERRFSGDAFQSNDTPIEKLRRVTGFVEA